MDRIFIRNVFPSRLELRSQRILRESRYLNPLYFSVVIVAWNSSRMKEMTFTDLNQYKISQLLEDWLLYEINWLSKNW